MKLFIVWLLTLGCVAAEVPSSIATEGVLAFADDFSVLRWAEKWRLLWPSVTMRYRTRG